MSVSIKNNKPHGNLKLNDTMITALSEAVAKGNYFITACNIVGISEPAFYGYIKKAQEDEENGLTDDDSLFLRLVKSLKRAEAIAESKLVDVVRESAEVKRDWLPAMTFLERRHPDRWGRKDRTAVTIDERKTITITHVEVVKPAGYGEIVEGESSRELEDNTR